MTEWIAYGASMKTWHPPYIRPLPQPNLLFNHFSSLLINRTLTPWLHIFITYSITYPVPSNYFSYLPANLNLLLVSYPGCWRWRANWVNERHPLLNAHIRPTSDACPWTLFNTYNQHHLPIGSRTSTMSIDAYVLHIDRPTSDAGPSIMSTGVVMIAIECSNNSSIAL